MSGLKKVLDVWQNGNSSEKSQAEDVRKWLESNGENLKAFFDNLLIDDNLNDDSAESLGDTLLKISRLPIGAKDKEKASIFDEWANNNSLKGASCTRYKNDLLYHVTTYQRLRSSADTHGFYIEEDLCREPHKLMEEVRRLNRYSNFNADRSIWVTWKNDKHSCHSIIDVYDIISGPNSIEEESEVQKKISSVFREGVINSLQLSKKQYREDYLIILCYRLHQDLDLKIPTVADARWGNMIFKPKSPSDECGSSSAAQPCNEGVHRNIDLNNMIGLVVLRPL